MKKPIKFMAVWIAFLLFSGFCDAQAVETVSQGKAKVSEKAAPSFLAMITGDGSALVLRNDDLDEAKEKALKMAKTEAIFKVVSMHVNSEILAKERGRLRKAFEPRQEDLIKEFKVIAEDQDQDGNYKVRIEAKVREDLVRNLLLRNLHDDRVIVVTAEKNMGNFLKRHILEHELIKKAKEKGYSIVDYRTVKNKTVTNLVSSIRQGNTESVKKMGLYYLTDLVIVGFVEAAFSQQTKEIYSANATGQIKIHQIGTKKEIASLTKHNLKGFGSGAEKAGIDAIEKISKQMTEDMGKGLPAKSAKRIKLSIREMANAHSCQRAKEIISAIPLVSDVRSSVENYEAEVVILFLRTSASIDYLAEKINESKSFVIKKIGKSEITLEARKI